MRAYDITMANELYVATAKVSKAHNHEPEIIELFQLAANARNGGPVTELDRAYKRLNHNIQDDILDAALEEFGSHSQLVDRLARIRHT